MMRADSRGDPPKKDLIISRRKKTIQALPTEASNIDDTIERGQHDMTRDLRQGEEQRKNRTEGRLSQ